MKKIRAILATSAILCTLGLALCYFTEGEPEVHLIVKNSPSGATIEGTVDSGSKVELLGFRRPVFSHIYPIQSPNAQDLSTYIKTQGVGSADVVKNRWYGSEKVIKPNAEGIAATCLLSLVQSTLIVLAIGYWKRKKSKGEQDGPAPAGA